METKSTKQSTKQLYRCELCDYNTSNKSNFNKHFSTRKHQMETGGNPKSTKQKTAQKKSEKNGQKTPFFCEFCNKEYISKSGYWKHRKGVNLYQKSSKYTR